MVQVAEKAADKAIEEDIEVEIIDLRTLSPMDKETIITSVEKTGRAIVVHEAPKTSGLGAEIAAVINLSLKSPVLRVTGQDVIVPLPQAEDYYIPNVARIVKALRNVMEF